VTYLEREIWKAEECGCDYCRAWLLAVLGMKSAGVDENRGLVDEAGPTHADVLDYDELVDQQVKPKGEDL